MPTRFASGKYTNKFDVETPAETVERVNNTMENMGDQQDEFEERMNRAIQDMRRSSMQHRDRLDAAIVRINSQCELHERFLRSTFVRVLNFFGQWYIYGTDGHVYTNTLENASRGPVPLLTRIGRALNRTISGISNAFRPGRKNDESGDTEEGEHLLSTDDGPEGTDELPDQVQ